MTHPEPNITVKVAVTNPGQFFACCGLLELADRLWPGAEGWFEDDVFCIICNGSLKTLLETLADTPINSSVTDEGLNRLGTLLSAKTSALTEEDLQEKEMLRTKWQQERLHLDKPFELWLDWWRDEQGERTPLKTWAAKQLILEIVRPLQSGLKAILDEPPYEGILQRISRVEGPPLYFDSHAQCQSTALDTGFSLYDLRRVLPISDSTKPALELLAFLGMQRFQLLPATEDSLFRFNVWSNSLPVLVASIAASGLQRLPSDRLYQFRLLNRTKYMKAFLPATPIGV